MDFPTNLSILYRIEKKEIECSTAGKQARQTLVFPARFYLSIAVLCLYDPHILKQRRDQPSGLSVKDHIRHLESPVLVSRKEKLGLFEQ